MAGCEFDLTGEVILNANGKDWRYVFEITFRNGDKLNPKVSKESYKTKQEAQAALLLAKIDLIKEFTEAFPDFTHETLALDGETVH